MTAEVRAGADPDVSPRPGADGPAGEDPPTRRRISLSVGWFERNALLLLLLAVFAFFSLWAPTAAVFPSSANVTGILGDQTVIALMALAAIFPLIVGEFDLSIGQLVTFLAVFDAGLLSKHHFPLWLAIVVTLAVAVAIGLGTGLLVAKVQLPSLVITLATGTVMGGLVLWYTGGIALSEGLPASLVRFGSGSVFKVPYSALLLAVVVIVAWHLLERTPAGRKLRFIGSNRAAARLVGVRVERNVAATFVLSALLSGVAAIVLTARNGSANPGDGPGLLFPAIAAAFLGATTVKPGEFNVLGTIVGVFFVAVSVSGLNLAGVQPWVQPVFYGVSLGVAVLMSVLLARHRAARPS